MVQPDTLSDRVEALGWYRYEIEAPQGFINATASIVEKLFWKINPLQIRFVDRNGRYYVSMRTPTNLNTRFNRIDWSIKVTGNQFGVHARAPYKRCRGCNGIYESENHCY